MIDPDKLRALDEREVERVCRALQAASRPDVDPDKLTPGPRGTVGLMPVWRLYEHMARAAILAMAEERMRADAARYRWLRDHSCPPHNFYIAVPDEFSGFRYGPNEVDAYIDAASRALGDEKAGA